MQNLKHWTDAMLEDVVGMWFIGYTNLRPKGMLCEVVIDNEGLVGLKTPSGRIWRAGYDHKVRGPFATRDLAGRERAKK